MLKYLIGFQNNGSALHVLSNQTQPENERTDLNCTNCFHCEDWAPLVITEHRASVYKHGAVIPVSSGFLEKTFQDILSQTQLQDSTQNGDKRRKCKRLVDKWMKGRKAFIIHCLNHLFYPFIPEKLTKEFVSILCIFDAIV